VRVFTLPMELHTRPGDLCYEPFAGSGSQLIAGDRIGRRVNGIELSEAFCDVVVERWQAFTGKAATLERVTDVASMIAALLPVTAH
jgi:DNA modification methylase